jgi:membrane protein involved in colicin uptake
MATMTVFGNYSKRHSRATAHLEKSIDKLKENHQNGLDYIKKLEIERGATQDQNRLQQIQIDLNYLQHHFNPEEMAAKVSLLEEKLSTHRLRLKKLHDKHAVKKAAFKEAG